MTYALRTPRTFSPEEYLLLERNAPFKSELVDGRIYVMSGASIPHITVNTNLTRIIGNQLRGSGCRALGNDMKVRTPSTDTYAYPDLTIVCGNPQLYDAEKDVLLNPLVIFEILSPSTQNFDSGEKFLRYKEIESLMEYVLISQSERYIEHYARQADGLWLPTLARGSDASISLPAVRVTLPLAELYEDVDFGEESEPQ
jgi:Uma2 family endonuclease